MAFRTSPSDPSDSGEHATERCVYCLGNAEIGEDQILARGRLLYLCAPLGQLTEGYLVIAPYQCIGSLSQLPVQAFPELARLKRIVEGFYHATYRVEPATYYEQGRAGGGAATDAANGFPLHAHLCCLPVTLDLHSILARNCTGQDLSGPHELLPAARGEPYVYVESMDAFGRYRRSVYRADSDEARMELRHMRLKPTIAELMNLPGRGDWRCYPGDQELQQLVMKFGAHRLEVVNKWHGDEADCLPNDKESIMAEAVEEIKRLATIARAYRDAGDPAAAAGALEQGIDALEAALTEKEGARNAAGSADADAGEAAIAVHLADLYGMLGGTLREEGNYLAAAAAYDRGFRLESDPRYAMQSTYNALNRLTARILLCPGCLADPDLLRTERDLEFVYVRHALADLSARLHRQVSGARAGDFWAAGDLSVTCALNGDEQGMYHGLEEFIRLSPPPTVYDAYRHSIEALARLDTPRKALLLTSGRAWSRQ